MLRVSILGLCLCAGTGNAAEGPDPHIWSHTPGQEVDVDGMPDSRLKRGIMNLAPAARDRAMATLKRHPLPYHELDHMFIAPDGGALGISCDHLPERPVEATVVVPAGAPVIAAASVPVAKVPACSSRPGSKNILYLDFNGHVVTNTQWNSSVPSFTALPFSLDGDFTTFSDAEQTFIRQVWQRVAEDFSPFDINVTTVPPATFTATTMRLLITPENDKYGVPTPAAGSGGMAYIIEHFREFDYSLPNGNTAYGPAWVNASTMYGDVKKMVDAISHEAGHNLGLSHDGRGKGDGSGDGNEGYYRGHGTGNTAWAPRMGVGYYANIVQWSKGEYPGANNHQDDLKIISGHLSYRPDDYGNTNATATRLNSSNGTISASGVIERNDDVDCVSFVAGAGSAVLTVKPSGNRNLDTRLTLQNAAGVTVATAAPTGTLDATITATLTAGTYYLAIGNDGAPTPPATGYTTYGSIGQWSLTGTVPVPVIIANHAPVATNQAVTTAANSAKNITLMATDADGDALTYEIASGPLHGTLSSGTGNARTYTPAANYSGADSFTFKAKDASVYSNAATVTITVTAATTGGPAGYTWCANEGGSFLLTGICDVAYGANGKFNYKYGVTGSITFSNSTFGDPIPYVGKSGYYRVTGASVTLPVITAQPPAKTIASGATATLTVTATGMSLAYQWYQGASGITTTPMSGATTTSFTTPVLTANTRYWVRISNGAGSVNSTAATVTVTGTGTGTGGPAGYTWCAKEGASFRLTGTCDVAYGANGKFAYKYGVTGLITFNNVTFGGDPISGAVKAGYYRTRAAAEPVIMEAAAPPDEGGGCGMGSGIAGLFGMLFMVALRLRQRQA